MQEIYKDNLIFKDKINNYKEVNKTLLEQIALIPTASRTLPHAYIQHTDYEIPKEMERKYFFTFYECVKESLAKLSTYYGASKIEIDNFWFHQYTQGGNFGMHTHKGTHFGLIYYVECPENTGTIFNHGQINCEEGDLLLFPAFMPHASPVIEDNKRKTVIAANLGIHAT